jgi:hypothetical protein
VHRLQPDMKAGGLPNRYVPPQLRGHAIGLRLRLLESRAVFQPADHPQRDVVALRVIVGQARREPDVRHALDIHVEWKQQLESRRQHAHDLRSSASAVQHFTAKHSRAAAIPALPVFVAQHRHGGLTLWNLRLAVGVCEIAAGRDPGA